MAGPSGAPIGGNEMESYLTEITMEYKAADGLEQGKFTLSTCDRNDVLKMVFNFMASAGWNMPDDIAEDVEELIARKFTIKHEINGG